MNIIIDQPGSLGGILFIQKIIHGLITLEMNGEN